MSWKIELQKKTFVKAERKSDDILQSWIDRYKSLWERASSAGYTPASDIADQLLWKSQFKADAHGSFIGEQQKEETKRGKTMNPMERDTNSCSVFLRN